MKVVAAALPLRLGRDSSARLPLRLALAGQGNLKKWEKTNLAREDGTKDKTLRRVLNQNLTANPKKITIPLSPALSVTEQSL